ncbi:MAG: hypothetical protein LBT00_13335 [Spirochaetaceae bacterium]|nr:hypothetical protein [Spirochaetaceae bacterium]
MSPWIKDYPVSTRSQTGPVRGATLKDLGSIPDFFIFFTLFSHLIKAKRHLNALITFSLRFNVRTGRKAHLWGERYWSEILAGEPPEWAEEVDWDAVVAEAKTPIPEEMAYALSWDSLRTGVWEAKTSFSPKNQPSPASPPG